MRQEFNLISYEFCNLLKRKIKQAGNGNTYAQNEAIILETFYNDCERLILDAHAMAQHKTVENAVLRTQLKVCHEELKSFCELLEITFEQLNIKPDALERKGKYKHT